MQQQAQQGRGYLSGLVLRRQFAVAEFRHGGGDEDGIWVVVEIGGLQPEAGWSA